MINLFFTGRVKGRRRYEAFACKVINNLLPRTFTKREVNIYVRFTKHLEAQGFCSMLDDDEILVEVNTNYMDDLASTLAHELVHAKQYIRRELNGPMTRWKKKEIPYGPRGGCKIPYRRQPWEREAFNTEGKLKELYW